MDDLLWQIAKERIHDDTRRRARAELADAFGQPDPLRLVRVVLVLIAMGGLVALWPLA